MVGRYPFLLLTLGLIAGIFIQSFWFLSIYPFIFFISLSFLAYIYSFKRINSFTHIIPLLFLLASAGSLLALRHQIKINFQPQYCIESYSGYIQELPKQKNNFIHLKVKLDTHDKLIYCRMPADSLAQTLRIGNHIKFDAALSPIQNFESKGGFKYDTYMLAQGIMRQAFLSKYRWSKTHKEETSIYIKSQKARVAIINFLTDKMHLYGDDLALVSSLVLGYQETMTDDLKQAFRDTGIVHILSVSGLHVGLIFAFLSFIFSYLPVVRAYPKVKYFMIILFLIFYSFLVGLSPSVLRASGMLILFCMGNLLNRQRNSLNYLFIVAFVMLVYNPYNLFNIGFQLSFVAVLFLLITMPAVNKRLSKKNKVLRFFASIFILSIIAQLFVGPIIFYYFGTFPVYFFLSNLIFMPIVYLLLLGNISIATITFLGNRIADYVLFANRVSEWIQLGNIKMIQFFRKSVHLFSQFPNATLADFYFTHIDLILFYMMLASFLIAVKTYKSKYVIYSITLLNILLVYNITKNLVL